MTRAAVLMTTLSLIIGYPLAGVSADQHDHQPQHMPPATETAEPVIKVSPDLRHLLQEEMKAVQKGMQDMLPLIAAGEWPQVAKIAAGIQQTFIMHQKLSPAQMEQLHQALPPEFIRLDQGFHQMAGMLSHVAEAGKVELVTFYHYKLTESCVSCHSRFASHRFPALAAPATADEHQH